jgi:hypothetical protein
MAIKILKNHLFIATLVAFSTVGLAREIVEPEINSGVLEPSMIQQKYMEARERVLLGQFSLQALTGALLAVASQMVDADAENFIKKQESARNFLKSVNSFLKDPSLFGAQTDNARDLRNILFSRLQKALEVANDLIATKNLTWQALSY